jgi:hypothetical protein
MDMLLNCDNRTPDHRRLCPCLPLNEQTELHNDNKNESVLDEKSASIKVDDNGFQAV